MVAPHIRRAVVTRLAAWRRKRLLDGIVRKHDRRHGPRRRSRLRRFQTPALLTSLAAIGVWAAIAWPPLATPERVAAVPPRPASPPAATAHPSPPGPTSQPSPPAATPQTPPRTVTVIRPGGSSTGGTGVTGRALVIDGDTISLNGQRVRLWGIDAPEATQTCRRQGAPWPCGRDAAQTLAAWLNGRSVQCQERTRDEHRRSVALCRADGIDVSGWLVDNGWALAYRHYGDDYVAREQRARAAGLGIWQSTFQAPWDWRHAPQ
jgi:endonuclease YncB( thermonuclease family)